MRKSRNGCDTGRNGSEWTAAIHPSRRLLVLLLAMASVSCTRVTLAPMRLGVVADAESGAPLGGVRIEVAVMQVSSFEGVKLLRTDRYASNAEGRFVLPARKRIADAVRERAEEMQYYEVIRFWKEGYRPAEFRTDAEEGPFAWSVGGQRDVLIRLWREPSSASE